MASAAERMVLSEKLCNSHIAAPVPVGSWNTVKMLLVQDLRRHLLYIFINRSPFVTGSSYG